jgi:hypothetical protein
VTAIDSSRRGQGDTILMAFVNLAELLKESDPRSEPERDQPGVLVAEGRQIVVQCTLERVAVIRDTPVAEPRVVRLDALAVDGDILRWRRRTEPFKKELFATRRGSNPTRPTTAPVKPRRRGNYGSLASYQPRTCQGCSESFTPRSGRQAFCSKCQERRGMRTGRRRKVASLRIERICAICGASYTPASARQRTCAPRCHQIAHNRAQQAWWRRSGSARAWLAYHTEGGKEQRQQARQAKADTAVAS